MWLTTEANNRLQSLTQTQTQSASNLLPMPQLTLTKGVLELLSTHPTSVDGSSPSTHGLVTMTAYV